MDETWKMDHVADLCRFMKDCHDAAEMMNGGAPPTVFLVVSKGGEETRIHVPIMAGDGPGATDYNRALADFHECARTLLWRRQEWMHRKASEMLNGLDRTWETADNG